MPKIDNSISHLGITNISFILQLKSNYQVKFPRLATCKYCNGNKIKISNYRNTCNCMHFKDI